MARRKTPITASSSASASSHTPKATRTVIRKFHILLKREVVVTRISRIPPQGLKFVREAALLSRADLMKLAEVRSEIQKLGGLEAYQTMSSIGQGKDRGGGTETVLVEWLQQYLPIRDRKGKEPVCLLEVGALKHDNYSRYSSWIVNTPIDLNSRHPDIQQQDFLLLDPLTNTAKWDVISLSLVVNFVPDAHDRGFMLTLARTFLRPQNGLLFLVLPAQCVQNSRYLNRDRLVRILNAAGLSVLEERLKPGRKLAYFLCRRLDVGDIDGRSESSIDMRTAKQILGAAPPDLRSKKTTVREGSNRNNFTILL